MAIEERITVSSHSSVRIELRKGAAIYVDPFGFADFAPRTPAGEVCGQDAAAIFFTHSHFDHFSPEDISRIAREDTAFVMSASMLAEAIEASVDVARAAKAGRLFSALPGDAVMVADTFVKTVPAYNIDKQFHPRENAWLGYVFDFADEGRIYVAGDTDVTPELLAVRADVVMLPIGGKFTMSAPEAARAVATMEHTPQIAIPTHFGTVVGEAMDGRVFEAELEELAFAVRCILPY